MSFKACAKLAFRLTGILTVTAWYRTYNMSFPIFLHETITVCKNQNNSKSYTFVKDYAKYSSVNTQNQLRKS
jgi:hypothetical protein